MNEQDLQEYQNKIEGISKKMDIPFPVLKLTFVQKITEGISSFLGDWPYFWIFTSITALWLWFNAIKIWIFDPPPYLLFTMCISVLAIYGNIFIQMASNVIMRYILWILTQMWESNRRIEAALALSNEKQDILNSKMDILYKEIKERI